MVPTCIEEMQGAGREEVEMELSGSVAGWTRMGQGAVEDDGLHECLCLQQRKDIPTATVDYILLNGEKDTKILIDLFSHRVKCSQR